MRGSHRATIVEAKASRAKASGAEACDKGLAKSMAWAQTVDITVNGKPARALVDTGAEVKRMQTRLKELEENKNASNDQRLQVKEF